MKASAKNASESLLPLFLAVMLVLIAFANFMWYLVEADRMGGIASTERNTADRYYVNDHGQYTEVSRSDWQHNYWHFWSMMLTHGLGFIGAGYLLKRMVRLLSPS